MWDTVKSVLDLDAPDSGPFKALAGYLERVSAEGLARTSARESLMAAAGARVRASEPHWQGPNGDAFRSAVGTKVGAEARLVEPLGADGYRALASLAEAAWATARAIDEIGAEHRNRVQAAWDELGELRQRLWINLQNWTSSESDADSERAHVALSAASAARDALAGRLDATLQAWARHLEATAAVLQRCTTHLDGALAGPVPPAIARHHEASYREEAITEDLQHRWIESVVEPRIEAANGDPGKLRALWDALSQKERDAIATLHPEVIRKFFPALTEAEKWEYRRNDRFVQREESVEVLTAVTVPLKVVDVRVGQVLKLTVTFNSDRSVEVLVTMDREAGVEVGYDDLVTLMGGVKGRAGLAIRFGSEDEYNKAREELQRAVEQDIRDPGALFGRTRDVLTESFGATEKGFQLAGSAISGIEAEFPEGVLPLRAGLGRDSGPYYNSLENEAGMYLTNQVYARVGPVDVKYEVDGRVYLKDGDRPYAKLTFTANASVSAPLLERSGFTMPQLENMGIGEGAQGTVAITVTTEGTNANRAHLIRLLQGVAAGRIQPADLANLHSGSEVTVAVGSGTARREGLPTNPLVDFEATITDTTNHFTFRKTPNGDYYLQNAP